MLCVQMWDGSFAYFTNCSGSVDYFNYLRSKVSMMQCFCTLSAAEFYCFQVHFKIYSVSSIQRIG